MWHHWQVGKLMVSLMSLLAPFSPHTFPINCSTCPPPSQGILPNPLQSDVQRLDPLYSLPTFMTFYSSFEIKCCISLSNIQVREAILWPSNFTFLVLQ